MDDPGLISVGVENDDDIQNKTEQEKRYSSKYDPKVSEITVQGNGL